MRQALKKLYSDPESERALSRIDYDFSNVKSDGFAVKFGALEVAMRESVPRAFRLLSKFADEVMGMKIVRVELGEEIV